MSTRLVILGLLKEQPLYGYELKQIIEERMGDWTDIAFGSIYYALDKLSDEGFIEKLATEKEGNRPSREIYQITAEGKQEFQRLLRDTWTTIEPQHFRLDVGLYFANEMSSREIINALNQRLGWLQGAIGHIESHKEQTLQSDEIPSRQSFWVKAIFEHSLIAYCAERDWITSLLARLTG